jgi:hypothetical protein
MKPGDLIGFSSYDLTGFVVNLGTYGIPFRDLSHIGIVAEYEDKYLIFESTTLCSLDCVIQGKKVSGAQAHWIPDRFSKYNGRIYHMPLRIPLSDAQSRKLTRYLLKDIGKPYDMIGAIRSGGWLFSWIESIFRHQDLNNLFCSEWCASALSYIGRFDTYSSSRWNPNKLERSLRRSGIIKERIRYV